MQVTYWNCMILRWVCVVVDSCDFVTIHDIQYSQYFSLEMQTFVWGYSMWYTDVCKWSTFLLLFSSKTVAQLQLQTCLHVRQFCKSFTLITIKTSTLHIIRHVHFVIKVKLKCPYKQSYNEWQTGISVTHLRPQGPLCRPLNQVKSAPHQPLNPYDYKCTGSLDLQQLFW